MAWIPTVALALAAASFGWVLAAHVALARPRREPLVRTVLTAVADWFALLACVGDLGPVTRRRPSGSSSAPAIVLLPDAALPAHTLRRIARVLARDGWEPVFCRHRVALLGRRRAVERARKILKTFSKDRRVALLGHGVGGLLAREAALACTERPDLRVVTIGTPHQGTGAWTYRVLCRDRLDTQARWIRELARHEAGDETVAICSDRDPYLVPLAGADLPGALNIEISGLGHFTPLRSRLVAQLVRENLAARRRSPFAPASPRGERCPPSGAPL